MDEFLFNSASVCNEKVAWRNVHRQSLSLVNVCVQRRYLLCLILLGIIAVVLVPIVLRHFGKM